jgi:hypothetical protein
MEDWSLPLADLDGIQRDFWFVEAACGRLLDLIHQGSADVLIMESLQSAAMVRYGRCFKDGVRSAFRIPGDWISSRPRTRS